MDFDVQVNLPDCFGCDSVRKALKDCKNGELLQKVVSSVSLFYERLQVRTLTWGFSPNVSTGIEISRRIADLPGTSTSGPLTVAFVSILDSGLGSFCVRDEVVSDFQAFDLEGNILFDNIREYLDRLQTGYVYCAGIPLTEYQSVCQHVRTVPKYLCEDKHYLCMRSVKCVKWLKAKPNLTKDDKESIATGKYRCKNCSAGYRDARKRQRKNATFSPGTLKKRTTSTSNYPFKLLSPRSKDTRYSNLRLSQKKDYQRLRRFKAKIDTAYAVDLDDEQSEELGGFVEKMTEEQVDKALGLDDTAGNLDEISLDKREAMRQAFLEDQRRNREGSHGNRWSMATYRIALSVYSRSPASYETLRKWGVFQLPSKSALKQYSTAMLQEEGPYFEYIRDQATKYETLKRSMGAEGQQPPNHQGVLILDEVKVVGKVMWNSKNGKMSGLAMDLKERTSLQDLFKDLDSTEERVPAEYFLQFLWRDLSSKFDIIGPHYSSTKTMDATFTHGCLLDAIHAFQMYKFMVHCIVLDGASTNLAMVKLMTGYSRGAFALPGPPEDVHRITPWCNNPEYSHLKIYFIICPTHQLKNMINQLWASQADGAKSLKLSAQGVTFGWEQIRGMWEREKQRRDNGLIRLEPHLNKAMVDRDAWTKLNVKPAKIMQQGGVLSELYSYANPDEGQQPDDHQQVEATYEYLAACNKLFEIGFLKKDCKITQAQGDATLESIRTGFMFFKSWMDRLRQECNDFSLTSPKEARFISWQTYDLLRICVYGFTAFCEDYLTRNPGYYIRPLKINGSAVETLFSQFKFAAGGKLTSINYQYAKRSKQLQREVRPADVDTGLRDDGYRTVPLYTQDVPLRKKKKT